MKRGIILLSLLVLLISPIVIATEGDVVVSTDDGTTIPLSEDATEQVKEKLSALRGGLDENTENVLEREVDVPKELEFLYFIITGKEKGSETISWGKLIVFILTVFAVFVGSLFILGFTAFETNWVKYLIAGGITLISVIMGLPYKLINIFYKLVNNFYYIVGVILAILVFLFILKPILNGVKNRDKISKAEELGIKSGAALKGLSEMTESITEN